MNFDFSQIVKNIFKKPAPSPLLDQPVEKKTITTNRQKFQSTILRLMSVDLEERETHGKNRSPFIDKLNKLVGQPFGTAYCATWASYKIDQACDVLGWKNPVGMTASSQGLFKRAPQKYVRGPKEKAKLGDLHIEQRYDNAAHGHAGLVSLDQVDEHKYDCIDANTNIQGSHDGGGVFSLIRSTLGDKQKRHRGFIDVCAWICEVNGIQPDAEFSGTVSSPMGRLEWEKGNPDRIPWTIFLYHLIHDGLLEKLDKAADVTEWNKDYPKWDKKKKTMFWCHFVCAMTKYESSYNPQCRYVETMMGIDMFTGRQVVSEGLLQLSYQDSKSYPTIANKLDWSKDKNLKDTDPKKTIFDPFINLQAGVGILAHLIDKHGCISRQEGKKWKGGSAYWAVLRSKSGSFAKIKEITNAVKF